MDKLPVTHKKYAYIFFLFNIYIYIKEKIQTILLKKQSCFISAKKACKPLLAGNLKCSATSHMIYTPS